jgi:hypothetical protein
MYGIFPEFVLQQQTLSGSKEDAAKDKERGGLITLSIKCSEYFVIRLSDSFHPETHSICLRPIMPKELGVDFHHHQLSSTLKSKEGERKNKTIITYVEKQREKQAYARFYSCNLLYGHDITAAAMLSSILSFDPYFNFDCCYYYHRH